MSLSHKLSLSIGSDFFLYKMGKATQYAHKELSSFKAIESCDYGERLKHVIFKKDTNMRKKSRHSIPQPKHTKNNPLFILFFK